MFRHTYRSLPLGSAVLLFGSIANAQSEARVTAAVPEATPSVNSVSVSAPVPVTGDALVVVKDLEPFTHAALIPVGSDLSSIRFQGVKAVTIPSRSRSITDTRYCEAAAFRGVRAHLSPDLCLLNCRRQQVPHPHQVVSGGREGKYPADF